jgi:hypothetical protein
MMTSGYHAGVGDTPQILTKETTMSEPLVLCYLSYDVPTTLNLDPCPRLRRIAAHTQLSCWVIPEKLIPHSYLNELRERGVTWDLVKFDATEAEKLITIAARGIAKDLDKTVKDCHRAINQAEAEYHNADLRRGKQKGSPLSVDEYEDRAAKAVDRALEVVGDLEEAARIFNIDPATLPVTWAAEQARVLRSAAHDRARRFAEAGKKAAEVNPIDGPAIANAVRADDIPVNVLGDFLTENGAEEEAESLVAAFAPDARLDDWGPEETLSWESRD